MNYSEFRVNDKVAYTHKEDDVYFVTSSEAVIDKHDSHFGEDLVRMVKREGDIVTGKTLSFASGFSSYLTLLAKGGASIEERILRLEQIVDNILSPPVRIEELAGVKPLTEGNTKKDQKPKKDDVIPVIAPPSPRGQGLTCHDCAHDGGQSFYPSGCTGCGEGYSHFAHRLQIDRLRFDSIVSDLKEAWRGGTKEEYLAIEFIADKIFNNFVVMAKDVN
jgi:hypothetical protein